MVAISGSKRSIMVPVGPIWECLIGTVSPGFSGTVSFFTANIKEELDGMERFASLEFCCEGVGVDCGMAAEAMVKGMYVTSPH